MLDFTKQEKKVLIFLAAVAILSMGVNYLEKINPQTSRLLSCRELFRVNINNATYEELVYTAKVSPYLARNILFRRQEIGAYRNWDELGSVRGIGETRLKKLKEALEIE